jgi:hypothetical protein
MALQGADDERRTKMRKVFSAPFEKSGGSRGMKKMDRS